MRKWKPWVAVLAFVLVLLQLPVLWAVGATVPGSAKDGEVRVILTSDMHYCTSAYYGVKGTDRLQLWVNSVIAEHQKDPIDLIIVNGDMSLDHFYSNGKIAGSYMGDNKVSYTEKFVKEYISQLPAEIPVRFVAGNHEQYNSAQWKSLTGNERQCSYEVEGNLFILLDNYNSFLEPNATENAVYTLSDMDFIQEEMAKYPDAKVWLVAHYFDANRESEAFKTLVKENDRIMGLFGGHDHMGDVKNTAAWGDKPYSMCGTFALSGTVTPEHSKGQPQQFGYTEKTLTEAQQESLDLTLANFWGFRELKITPTSANSNYISVATGTTAPYFYGKKIVLSRTTKYSAGYPLPTSTEVWGPASDGIYYIGSAADMQAFSVMGQKDNFAGKTVKLARDIDMTGVNWTMIPQFAGTFDGCGRAVKHLSLYATSGTLAMFDQLQDATIKNLRMVDGEVKLVDSHSAAGIAVRANGTCLFSNVYCKMTVSVDSDCYRAGGFLAFPERANLTFENCVSECTVSGMRGAGFVAQVNYNTYSTVFRDCAFIGNLSGAGKWSGGIVGLCAGNVSMERCVSLGKQSTNAESGGLIFIDHQNQSATATTEVYLKDCYAAVDTQVPIGTQASRSFRLKFTMEYTGKSPLTIQTSESNRLSAHQNTIQSNFGYLAKGSTVNLTASNLKTLCPTFTNWSSVGGTVAYGEGKTLPKILPMGVWELMNGKSITAPPASICTLCGGNAKKPENLGNGTHLIACDRNAHSIEAHSYSKGICACGQRECPYLLLDFLPLSIAHEEAEWIPTARETGMLSFSVDPDNRGTMEATVQYRDAYVSMAKALDKLYPIHEGDVIEVRLKGEIAQGSCPRTTVYFTTDSQKSYSESHQLTHAMTFDGSYKTVTLGNLDSYVGQSIHTLRIDVFQNASTDFSGTYSLDYIYVGPAQYAPSESSSALYFDFSNDEYSAQRYGTSTYRGYNYDVGDNWRRGETGTQPVVEKGKLCFDITERYNGSNEPVHITAIEPVGNTKTFSWGNDSKYANDLSYDPSKAEVLQIRLKLTDVQHYYPNSAKQYLRFFYLPEGATEWSCGTAPNDWAESILAEIPDCYMDGGEKEGEFFTLTVSLKGKKFSAYESIRGIMLNFMGMRGGKAEIDYIYIGPATAESLLFDFDGTGWDRYDNISYGMMNYDSLEHWYHEGDVSDLTIANGELSITTAATVKNDHTQYAETTKTPKRYTDPLHYTPKAGAVVQLRYRLLSYDASLNSGKTASITVYGWDSEKTTSDYLGTSWVAVDTAKLGTYAVKTWNIPAGWTDFDIGRLRITLRGMIHSQLAVDYLYVGSGCAAPEPVHTYTYKATKDPTTSATGTLTGTCSRCSGTTTVTLPKLNTTDYSKTTITAATCTATGVDKYTWKTTTYGTFSFNATTAAKGHTSVADPAVAATCTTTGKTAGAHCSVCNAVLTAQTSVEALGHNYNSVVTAPTCTAQGYTTHTCSRCSHSYKDSYTNATGHSYNSGSVTTQPTCTATGIKTFTCTACKATKTESVPAKGHTEVTDKAVAPTCTETGLTEGKHCSVCNTVLTAQEVVPAKGHTEVIDKAVAPTCTETGLTEGKHCSVCSTVLTAQDVLPATGHSYAYEKIDVLTHRVYCSNCNVEEITSHVFVDGSCICGEVEIKDPVLDSSLKLSHSLNLASDISINFVVPAYLLEGYDMSTVYAESTVENYEGESFLGTETVRMEPVEMGSYYYFTLTGITAVQMNDTISTVLYGEKEGQLRFSNTDLYSVAQYAYSQLNKPNSTETLKTLCADLLRYGAKAQIYKEYRVSSLSDADMTEEHKSYLSDLEAVTFGNNSADLGDLANAPITWVGKTLDLDSKVCLKFVFSTANYNGQLSDLSLKVRYRDIYGETMEVTVTELTAYDPARDRYAFSVDALLASELREVVSVQIWEGDKPVSSTFRYSADTYGNGKSGNLLELCKALFAYSDSAKVYFAN